MVGIKMGMQMVIEMVVMVMVGIVQMVMGIGMMCHMARTVSMRFQRFEWW